jgi:membrane protein YdbS with pleckstrin-like domain
MSGDVVQFLVSLPLPLTLLVALGVPLVLALGLGQLILSVFTPQDLATNAGVGTAKYGFIVEVYAVVAALSLVGAWDIYQTSRDNLQRETGALYLLALSVPSYGEPSQAPRRAEMYASLRGYAGAVATKDWPHMLAANNRSGSDAEFQRLTRAFLDVEPVTGAQQALAQNVVGWVAQVSEARIARLSQHARSFATLIWVLVLTVSVAVLAFQWFVGSANNAVHYTMGGVIAVIVGVVLMVSGKLAFPFNGDPPFLSPAPFVQMMGLEG